MRFFLFLCSLVLTFWIVELGLRYREVRAHRRSLGRLDATELVRSLARSSEARPRIKLFNGCLIQHGILVEHSTMGYTNVPHTRGYSIRAEGRQNYVVRYDYDLSVFSRHGVKTDMTAFRINNLGNRGTDTPVEKPNGVHRVVFLGDSVTFGYYVNEEETFPVLVGTGIQELVDDGFRVEVMNAGVSSLNAQHVLAHLRERAFTWSPDLVVWCFYANDIYDAEGAELDLFFPVRQAAWMGPIRSSALGRLMLGTVFASRIGATMSIDDDSEVNRAVAHAWKDIESNLIDASAWAHQQGTRLLVVVFPSGLQLSRSWTRELYQGRIKRICRSLDIRCVDVLSFYEDVGSVQDLYYEGDLVHPSLLGHAVAADAILTSLRENRHLLLRPNAKR